MNKYQLNTDAAQVSSNTGMWSAVKKMAPFLADDRVQLVYAGIAIVINAVLNLVGPVIAGDTIDKYIQKGDYHGVLVNTGILLAIYATALFSSYAQTRLMGGVGQRVLFRLRNAVFSKLQALPVAFFQQNKAGDLISRINNDTDKLGQFFSQALMQFIGNIFLIIGSGIAMVSINWRVGLAALVPALCIFIFTKLLGPWVKRQNAINMTSIGGMSAEIQESLNNFKVVVAFNRRDFFRTSFKNANELNYSTAVKAGVANNTFTPIYGLASNAAILTVLLYGFHLISLRMFTFGLLISFITYLTRFYDPLRQMAALWTNFQVALAGWDRIHAILQMENDLKVVDGNAVLSESKDSLIEFRDVSFQYAENAVVLEGITFTLQHGKTYALVGPTGGGKTTTASLMARLFDPTTGTIYLNGRDLKSYTEAERAQKIGFILQEPYLFTGTVGDNIRYANEEMLKLDNTQLGAILKERGLDEVLAKFPDGLETKIEQNGESMSLGQKQLIAFVRAILRSPELLILDEATANIDTVTEQLLEAILRKLPKTTTRVVIAHRLNTIADADTIFFVNGKTITEAGSMEHAVDMLLHNQRKS